MKNMRFLRPHRHRTFRPLYLAAAAAMAAALLAAAVRPQWLDMLFLEASGGVFPAHAALIEGADTVTTRFMSRQELVAQNTALRDENAHLTIRAALYDEVVDERNRIYERFGREPVMSGVLARVLAAPSRSPYDVLLIDAGSDDGVAPGDEAWFDTTLMLGTVESVSFRAARVRLLSSPGVETQITVGTTTDALFTAIGSGGGSFVASIPKDIVVQIGDAFISPGEGRGALGFVRETVVHDTDSFQTVRAILPVNLFETREVLIRPGGR